VDQVGQAILVLEDDDDVRELICGLLTEAGFAVSSAATGFEAVALIEEKRFDLMVVDIQLPGGLNGLQLVKHARSRHPALRCLFTSGTNAPIVCDPMLDDFIDKPFRPFELLGCVWKVLSGNNPPPRLDIAKV
jgi:DNA-binding response OmpR family regulator